MSVAPRAATVSPVACRFQKATEWQAEEQQIKMAIQGLQQIEPDRVLDSVRILELANKAYFLYLKQTPVEKAKLLRMVLSNFSIDAVSIHPTYRKLFDLIFTRAKKRGMVRSSGFEPPRYCYRQPLKLVRLPVPPRPHKTFRWRHYRWAKEVHATIGRKVVCGGENDLPISVSIPHPR